ncbi:MAG: AIPR family protein [Nitrospirae bacterium]|nr:AIPR family protein [Nitrospirota bacterium]
MDAWKTAFESRTDLNQYEDNALGLFALALKFGIDDLDTVAADSITDGSDDKKCDIVFINKDDGIAVVAQCYISTKERKEAPANKASDLNTAVSWLLQRPIDELPEKILSAAQELRDGITSGNISSLHIWYIHNLPESKNVENELITVEATANSAIHSCFAGKRVAIQGLEVGRKKLEEWYTETQSPILVNDKFVIEIPQGYEVNGPEWKAYITAIPARFLHRQYKKYKTKLFSANVRDYLGSRLSDSNINNSIKKSAEKDAANFWVFNNGLTILVNRYEPTTKGNKNYLTIQGISIVNGAQTTGAIGSMTRQPSEAATVPARFVQTENRDLVHSIIQFNNSQNKITASDFRSTDKYQKKLKEQISKIPDAEYEGGRRGGYSDAIRRRPKLLPSYTVGQALASFHGDSVIAYNQKANIWADDQLYSRYFNDETKGAHIVCAYALLRAVEDKKLSLVIKSKKSESGLTTSEEQQLQFFRKRGSTYLLASAVASCLETFLNRKIPNRFRISFSDKTSPKKAQDYWMSIVNLNVPLCTQLEDALTDGLKSAERVSKAIQTFQSLVQVTMDANRQVYNDFSSKIVAS